ncbi:MAG: hypothetical protein ACTHQQ_07265 [Solirubrobacteraceae bacterium]
MKRNKIALSASLVALGIGAGGFAVASPGTANPTPRAGVPQFVARCLARPEAERGACFAAAPSANRGDQDRGGANPSAPGGRGGIPNFVAHCLAAPEAERGACFAAAAGAN